jgi:hypothetical protein
LQIDITGCGEGLVAVLCGHVRHRSGRHNCLCGESRSAARRRRQRELCDNPRNLWRALAVETETLTARARISWQKVAADLGCLASFADARWWWHDAMIVTRCRPGLQPTLFRSLGTRNLSLWARKKTPGDAHLWAGKKTPKGAGTHTGHSRDTRAHEGTRISHRRASHYVHNYPSTDCMSSFLRSQHT